MQNELRKRLHGQYFSYDTQIYDFKTKLERLMGSSLGSIHEYLGSYSEFARKNDQSTLAHKVFYSNFSSTIKPIYDDFMVNIVAGAIKEPFYYQVIPTFRIALPGNKFVGEFHTDSKYDHQPYEINFNVGIDNYKKECGLIVRHPGGEDEIFDCKYGNFFSFDHIDLLHGSPINNTGSTMVSFDFRVAPLSMYFDSNSKSINMSSSFSPGSYFSLHPILG